MSEPVPPSGVRVVTPLEAREPPVRFVRHEPDGMALWAVDVTADEASALVSGLGSLEVDVLPPRTSLTVDVSAADLRTE